MGLRKTELRRIAAENEYEYALKDYGAWRLETPKAQTGGKDAIND